MDNTLQARYLIETPLDPAQVAEVLAGEQSSGTFVRVAGESDELRARSRAIVEHIEELEPASAPSLPSAWLERQGRGGPWRRARITVAFPLANLGANLPTLAATVAGNLYDLGETSGVRLEREGPVSHCQGTALVAWRLRGPDGEERGHGHDVFELAPGGRIAAVTGLWAPAAPTSD